MNTNMVYFELFDIMKDNCCPVCELIHKRTVQAMDGFLYENVNDTGLRRDINSAKGFCPYHSNMLLSMGDPLSHAIVYSDLIKSAINDVTKDNFSAYDNHSDCPYCKNARKLEKTYCTVFIEGCRNNDFFEKYKSSAVLCMSHLQTIKKLCESKHILKEYEKIRDATTEHYNAILLNLAEIRRKNDYRFTSEGFTQDEKSAWRRAVGIISSQDSGFYKNTK